MSNWLNVYPMFGANDNFFRRLKVMSAEKLGDVAAAINKLNLTDIVYGEFTEWARSVIFYPISIDRLIADSYISDTDKPLMLGKTWQSPAGFDVHTALQNMYSKKLIFMGSFKFQKEFNDYRDYEPFTSVEVYLPYSGYCSVKVADIIDKTLYINLEIDWFTGQGLYYITAGDRMNSRIIGTHVASIGSIVPMGQNGAAETTRNILMSAVRGAATIAGYYYGGIAGAATVRATTSTSTTEDVSEAKVRNDATGRMVKASSSRGTSETTTNTLSRQVSNRWKRDVIESCFSSAANVVTNFQFHPSIDKANNPAIDCNGATEVHVITRRSRFIPTDSNYAHLYGYPCGEVLQLSNVHGYTECSAIHIEGDELNTATNTELSMISEIMSGGVILP